MGQTLSGSAGVWTYRAAFGLSDGNANKDLLAVESHLHVLRDVALEPSVLSCDFTDGDVRRLEKTIRVTRIVRADKLVPILPSISNLPPTVKVMDITEVEPLTHLETNLWEQSWSVKFSVEALDGSANVSALSRGVVTFADGAGKTPINAEFPIIIHRVYGIESPELSHFGVVPSGERRVRRLVIRSADERDFEVRGVHTDSEAFSASYEVGQARKSHILDVAFQTSKPGVFAGHLILETNHPECPTLKIDLAATVPADEAEPAAGPSEAAPKP